MVNCSLLSPAFILPQADTSKLRSQCGAYFGKPVNSIELFALIPLADAPNKANIAVSIKQNSFSLTAVEELLQQNELLKQQLKRAKDALSHCTSKIANSRLTSDTQKYTRRIQKLKEDNKKLRGLLKQVLVRTQLENAENLRVATQKVVEDLREEFDLLVRELVAVKEGAHKTDYALKFEKKTFVPKFKS